MSLCGSIYALRHALTFFPALSDESSLATARAAVALLHHDALAQLLSFSAAPSAPALRALSPRARLYAELHAAPCRDSRADGCASLRGGQLVYAIVALWGTGDVETLRTSLWWAERCGLPLTLEVDNTCANVLDALSGLLRGRVATLHLHFTTVAPCPSSKAEDAHDAVTKGDGSSAGRHTRALESSFSAACVCRRCPVSVADLLPSLTALTGLFVDCYCDGPNGARAAAVIAHLLQAAPPPTLREVKFSRCSLVHNPLVLSDLPHLRRLEVLSCEVRKLGDVKACEELEEVEVVFCDRLPSLVDLRGAPQLHKLTAFLCGLRSLDGLSDCPHLTELDVSHNPTLASLSALKGAARLRRLKAIKCRLRSVDGVGLCPFLTHIDVSFNTHLQTLTALSGAPALVSLKAVHCGLRSVDGLKDCLLLAEVDVSTNYALDSLVGLAGAPGLEKLTAVGCNLVHLDGLELCPLLTSVDVSNNHRLRSLSSLAGAPSLKKVRAAVCQVQSTRGLGSCPRLQDVDLSFNVELSSIADLAGALQLRVIDVHATGVRDVSVLRACRSLVKVDASHCSSLNMDYHLPNVEVITEKEKS